MMRGLRVLVASAVMLSFAGSPAWAITTTTSATVTTTVPLRASVALTRDSSSSTRGTVGSVLFDKYDDQDAGVTAPSPNFMYAPYRSEVGKNWHMARILANGSTMTLNIDVTGTVGTQSLKDLLSVFCGGFYPDTTDGSASTAIAGTASTDWELADTFTRTISGQTFTGIAPFNYRLTVTGVRATSYTGTVTFQLVAT